MSPRMLRKAHGYALLVLSSAWATFMALVAREHQGYPWPVLFWVCCSALGGTCFLVIAAVMMLEAAEDRWLARRGGHRDAP